MSNSINVIDKRPSKELLPYVKTFKLIESNGHVVNSLLPDTHVALAFRLRGSVEQVEQTGRRALAASTISGLRNSVREVKYSPGTTTLVALLTPVGAALLLREPVHTLFNQTVSLDEVLQETSAIEDSLQSTTSVAHQLQAVETFLTQQLRKRQTDEVVSEAIRLIERSHGLIRIRELSSALCISQDAFEKRFRRIAGSSPKQFANIVRMRQVILSQPADLAQVTYDFEFYDAAHFSKSFRQFTGKTPSEFFKGPRFW